MHWTDQPKVRAVRAEIGVTVSVGTGRSGGCYITTLPDLMRRGYRVREFWPAGTDQPMPSWRSIYSAGGAVLVTPGGVSVYYQEAS